MRNDEFVVYPNKANGGRILIIVLTNHYPKEALTVVEKCLPAGFEIFTLEKPCKSDLLKKARVADYFLVSGRLPIDKEIIHAASKLKMIQRTGVGLDSLDLAAIKERNIPVYVNSGVNSRCVAEHTILLMLATLRRLPSVCLDVRQGIWEKQVQGLRNHSLFGKVVGLIGMGNIAQNVARMLKPFGVKVLYHSRSRLSAVREYELAIEFVSMKVLLKEVEILSLHCPLTHETHGFIGEHELATMKRGSIIINTARGGLIDEGALTQSLKNGHVQAAGLDVYQTEPLPRESELRSLPNVILTPHIAGITSDSFYSMIDEAMNNIRLFESGQFEQIAEKRLEL